MSRGPAERTEISPIAEGHEFGDRDRKPAVEFVLLRQIGQPMAGKSGANDFTGGRPNNSGKRFQERAFPGPVWAHDGREARGRELAGQALKRVSIAVAHGKIANSDPAYFATTASVGGAGIVAAIEMTGERSLRVMPERCERIGE